MHGCVRDFNRKSKMIHQGSDSGHRHIHFQRPGDIHSFTVWHQKPLQRTFEAVKNRSGSHVLAQVSQYLQSHREDTLTACEWDSESLCGSKIEHNDDIMALRFQNNAKLWGQRLSNTDMLECTESLGYWERNLSHPLPWHAAATTRWEPSLHLAANASLLGTFGKSTKHTRLRLEVFGCFLGQPRF